MIGVGHGVFGLDLPLVQRHALVPQAFQLSKQSGHAQVPRFRVFDVELVLEFSERGRRGPLVQLVGNCLVAELQLLAAEPQAVPFLTPKFLYVDLDDLVQDDGQLAWLIRRSG